jgi:hypothetical protein
MSRFASDAGSEEHLESIVHRPLLIIWQAKCEHPSAIQMIRSTTACDPLTDAIGSSQAGWQAGIERRRSPRAALHWTLYLMGNGARHPLRTETRDISRDGFYCLLDQPLSPGERIRCDIVVPTHNAQDPDDVVYLRCSAQALRVEKLGAGTKYGIACRIEDYYVVHGARNV